MLFGGISTSFSNYALKQTSVDNKKFRIDAAKTLRQNFYVDDMEKFSKGIAVDLIQQIRNNSKVGGFNLMKFVSNKTEVMKSIPWEHRRKNINIKELESGDVQRKEH